MSAARALFAEVRQLGGNLWLDSGRLRYRLPDGTSPAFISRLRSYKPELLKLLAANDGPHLSEADRTDVQEAVDERAAIQEFDGGLSREEAEEQAQAAMRVYRYRLVGISSWLTLGAPGCSLKEARRILERTFGAERVIEVEALRWVPDENRN